MHVPKNRIEACREFWAKIAKKNGWYKEPFFVHVWADSQGNVTDSVSYQGLTIDVFELVGDFAHCASCDCLIDLDYDQWTSDDNDTYCESCR